MLFRSATDPAASSAADLGERIDSVQREAIQKALEANRFNKTAAARQLGLTLRALRYRMGKLGME
ncbi:MAG: hypothetical protein HKUEN07_28890 [Rhodocyclaceae bacterium]|nr:MAG: hypothetical protein HKUEN07_28890 [Rhodocyclaceae bacterium]